VTFDKKNNLIGFATHAPSSPNGLSLMIQTELVFISVAALAAIAGLYIAIKSKKVLASYRVALLNKDPDDAIQQGKMPNQGQTKTEQRNLLEEDKVSQHSQHQ
jgi:hypothetical protein